MSSPTPQDNRVFELDTTSYSTTIRHGVENQETVLQQVKTASNIITLESDEDEDEDEYLVISKPLHSHGEHHNTHSDVQDLDSTTQRLGARRSVAPSTYEPKEDAGVQRGVKKTLFKPYIAKESMNHNYGLPSPPSSNNSSSESHSISHPHENVFTSRAFGPLDHLSDSDLTSTVDDPAQLSLQLSTVLHKNDGEREGFTEETKVRNSSLHEARRARSAAETEGVTKSSQLRAQRIMNRKNAEVFPSRHPCQTPDFVYEHQPKKIHARKYRRIDNERRCLADQSESDPEDVWEQRDLGLLDIPHQNRASANDPIDTFADDDQSPLPYPTSLKAASSLLEVQNGRLERNKEELEPKYQSINLDPLCEYSQDELQRREQRMARVKANMSCENSLTPGKPQGQKSTLIRSQPPKFVATELEKTLRVPGRSLQPLQATSRTTVRNLLTNRSTQPVESYRHIGPSGSTSSGRGVISGSMPPSSALEAMVDSRLSPSVVKDIFDTLPEQGTDLSLHPRYDTWSPSQKQYTRQREILRDRERDLKIIRDTFQGFADLLSMDRLSQKDLEMLKDLKRFSDAVLDRNRSGKPARSRIATIKKYIQQRIATSGTHPSPKNAAERFVDLLHEEFAQKLQEELRDTELQLSFMRGKYRESRSGTSRNTYRADRRDILQARLTLFSMNSGSHSAAERNSSPEIIDLPGIDEDSQSEISEENDGEEFMLPPKVALTTIPPTSHRTVSLEELQVSEDVRQHDKGEEVIGEQAIQAHDQKLLEQMISRKQQQEHAQKQRTQKHDSQLLQEMRVRQAANLRANKSLDNQESREVSSEVDVQVAGDDSMQTDTEQEFDDSDINDDEAVEEQEEDDEGQPQCKRYVVKTVCFGVSREYDEHEHRIGNYLKREKAIKKALSVAPLVKSQSIKQKQQPDFKECKITLRDSKDEWEQQATFSDGESAVACRVWIEEELYNPSKEAYANAKVSAFCKLPDVWFVDWERTIQPIEDGEDSDADYRQGVKVIERQEPGVEELQILKQPRTGASHKRSLDPHQDADSDRRSNIDNPTESPDHEDVIDDGFDDLFDSDPEQDNVASSKSSTPPSSGSVLLPAKRQFTKQPTVTRATGDHLRIFTDLAFANRHAKDVFMQWYISHLPGAANCPYLESEDQAMEEQLEQIGNRTAWQRTEHFNTVGEDDMKMNECFKVWVRKARSSNRYGHCLRK